MNLRQYTSIFILTIFIVSGFARSIPCLDGCTCDNNEHDPVIRCDSLGLDRFPLPHSSSMKGYHFIALTCNDLQEIPSLSMIKAAFPDLQGIDLQGNPRLNCSDLSHIIAEIPTLTDCNKTEDALQCDNLNKDCDWKCRALTKLKTMWAQFKDLIARKSKEWEVEEQVESAKSWFAAQFKKFKVAIGDLSD